MSQEITRLGAAVRMPGFRRENILFVGWDANGSLAVSVSPSTLSEEARTSYQITKAVQFPFGKEFAALPVLPVEFVGAGSAFDKQDPKEEDVLRYWVTRGGATPELVQVEELDMLASILKGQFVWEDFSESSYTTSDKRVRGMKMYSLFVPALNAKGETIMYLMTFKPPMKDESNLSMYKQFISQTLKTLVAIDQEHIPAERKGYIQAIDHHEAAEGENSEGGLLAVGTLDILRNLFPDMVKIDDARMIQVRRDSNRENIVTQAKIILRELGLYDISSKPRTGASLDTYDIDGLLAVTATAFKLATRAITGKTPRGSSWSNY